MRKLVVGLLALLAVAIGALLALPSFIDWNRHRDAIAAAASELAGREVEIAGDIGFRLLPEPVLALDGLDLAERDGIAITVGSARARLDLPALFLGRVEVGRLTLVDPVVDVSLDHAKAARTKDGAATAVGSLVPDTAFPLITIEGGILRITDPGGGTTWTVDGIAGEGSARSPRGPFSGRGRAAIDGLEIDFALNVAKLRAGGVVTIPRFRVDIARAGARLIFSGTYRLRDGLGALGGQISIEARDLALLAGSLGGAREAPLPRGPVAIAGRLDSRGREVALNDLDLTFAGTHFFGALSAVVGRTVRFDLVLEANRVDLDAMEAAAKWDAAEALRLVSGATACAPPWLLGRIDVDLGGLTYRNGVLRRTRLSALLADGSFGIEEIDSLLPGDTRLTFVAEAPEGMRTGDVEGRIELASGNPARLLEWLGLDMAGLPPGRLQDLTLAGRTSLDGDLMQLTGLDVRLDDTRARGGLTYRFQQRPVLGVVLALDRLDLDSYLAGVRDLAAWRSRLAPLDRIDANLQLGIARLTAGGLAMEALELDAGLTEGRATVRRARIGALAGASIAFNATAGDFAAAPRLKARYRLAIDDPSRLARALGLADAAIAKRFGRAGMEGDLELDFERLTFRTATTVSGLRLTAAGRLEHNREKQPFELDLEAEVGDMEIFAAALGLPSPRHPGRNAATARLTGDRDGLSLDLRLEAAGGTATLTGRIAGPVGNPDFDVAITMNHPDPAVLLGLETGFSPLLAGSARDAQVSGKLRGRWADFGLDALSLRLGDHRAVGEGRLVLGRARPEVDLRLRTEEIVLAPPARFPPLGADGQPWPETTMALDRLPEVDGRITVESGLVRLGDVVVKDAEASFAARPGLIVLDGFRGRIFGGELKLAGRLLTGETPGATVKFDLTNADLATLLGAARGAPGPAGRITIAGALDTLGATPRVMARGLTGGLAVEISRGELVEFAIARLDARLADPVAEDASSEALARVLAGEGTNFSLEGQWHVSGGVARTLDSTGWLGEYAVALRGEIDLAAWRLDIDARARLPGVGEGGPDLHIAIDGPIERAQARINLDRLARALARRARAAR